MPTSEVKPALVRDPATDERGLSTTADSDDTQMELDPLELAESPGLPVPPNSQFSSDSRTTVRDEQTKPDDSESGPPPPPPPPPSTRPRVRVRRVSPRTLNQLRSSNELLYVMYCAIEAHRQLYERAGVLHGDINPNTILILDWPASASEDESSSGCVSPATCALGLLAGAAPATHSTSESQASGSASPSQRPDDMDDERDEETESEGYTEGALVDFDVPYSAAAWRHPRPGPFKWENHSALRMRRYGFY